MKKWMLVVLVLAGSVSWGQAQIKIGNRTINTKKVLNAASEVASAITLSDEDVAALCRESVKWMDEQNPVSDPGSAYSKRLDSLMKKVGEVEGLKLNYKVYEVVDINAFACGDGSIRVFSALMDLMDDDELMAVIGHEIGHVVHTDSKDAMKNAYLAAAAKSAAGAAGGVLEKLTDSQLGEIAQALSNAQFSQKQETEADEYGFEFCIKHGFDPYGMANALEKLNNLSEGQKASKFQQMTMAAGFERIFETGPVFRAEKSYTNKHATEFSGFDLEFSYITSYKDVMAMEEQLLKAGLQAVKDAYGDQIQELFGKEVIVPETPFPVVKLADLYKGLEEDFGYVVDDSEKGDLTTEAERLSYDWVKKHYNHEFLFVTDYDAEKRAFYHMRDENGVPQGYDLIWRGVEITTGAQREHRYEVLKKQAEEKGLAEDVKFYLEFFQYGCPPHGGFGLGIDRLTMLLVGESIKDAEFLFRGPNRLTP